MFEFLAIIFLLAALGAAVYFWRLWRHSEKTASAAAAEQIRADARLQNAEQVQEELQNARQKLQDNAAHIAKLESDLKNEQRNAEEKNALLKNTEKEMNERFENLAQKIFSEKSRLFNEENEKNLKPLLEPLKQNIQEFRDRVDILHNDNTKERATLTEHIKNLNDKTVKISNEAENLTLALKGKNKTQGNWGELTLLRILEDSGLRKDIDYKEQLSVHVQHDDKDNRRNPDFVIYLPDKKHLIIDSKISLVAYERYVAAEDDKTREVALKEHIESVKNHVKQLASKFYQHAAELNPPDVVFLFMAIEPALITALQNEPDLFNKSYNSKIVLTSPTTLPGILRTVAHLWKKENQQRNADAIAEQGGKLYDKFCGFIEDMEKIDKHIGAAQDTYDTAFKKLSTGSGNLIGHAQKLQKLGVRTKKELDDKYQEEESPPSLPPAAD